MRGTKGEVCVCVCLREKKNGNEYGKVLGETHKTGSIMTILLRLGI